MNAARDDRPCGCDDPWCAAPTPGIVFPYAHRMDLPEHERGISDESLAKLRATIERAKSAPPLSPEARAQYILTRWAGALERLGR